MFAVLCETALLDYYLHQHYNAVLQKSAIQHCALKYKFLCAMYTLITYLYLNVSKCFPVAAVDVVNTKMFHSINQTNLLLKNHIPIQ